MIKTNDKRFNQGLLRFERATKLFDQIRSDYAQDRGSVKNQVALAHAFVILFEVSWKLMSQTVRNNGTEVGFSPKAIIINAGRHQLIKDSESWIEALQNRNRIAHIYDIEISQQAIEFAENKFPALIDDLARRLKLVGDD